MRPFFPAFTLVELIVVITIIWVLSTIGFVSYSNYLTWARDSNRYSQLTKLSDSLQVYATQKSLPLPDDYIEITASWATNVIAYQGYVWSDVLETIDYTNWGRDPKDNSYYTYYLTKDRKSLQMMALMEEAGSVALTPNLQINKTFAADYSDRYPKVYWRKLWVLTEVDTNTPVQELTSIKNGSWYLDILNTNENIISTIDNWNVLQWTWNIFLWLSQSNRTLALQDNSLVLHMNFSDLSNTWRMADWSKYNNDLLCYENNREVNCSIFASEWWNLTMNGNRYLASDKLVYDLYTDQFTYIAKVNLFSGTWWALIWQYTKDLQWSHSYENHAFRLYDTSFVYDNWPPSWWGFKIDFEVPNKSYMVVALRRSWINWDYYLNWLKVLSGSWSSVMETFASSYEDRIQNFVIWWQTYTNWVAWRLFDGMIDEIRIYNRALSDEEIKVINDNI